MVTSTFWHQYIMSNDEVVWVVITPKEYKKYVAMLSDNKEIIESTEKALHNWETYDTPKEAMEFLQSL